jgi:hypothetical protein
LLLVAALVVIVAQPQPALASSVEPGVIAGNPSCIDLGYDFGFKPQPEPPPSGTYSFPGGPNTVTLTSDGTYFDWVSTLGIDAVIAKGGPNANVYGYDPESFSDTGLRSPINPNNNQPYAISHIEFCYDYELDVSKDASTTFTRTYDWTIEKTVSPDSWQLFTGDSGTSKYTVSVTRTYTDSDWAVSGTITIENNTPFDATVTGVTDVVSTDIAAVVECGITFPITVLAGDSLVCSYSTPLPDGSNRVNTSSAATTGLVGDGTGTADVVFGEPTTTINATVNVSDSNGGSWPFNDSGSVMYERTFACGADEGAHSNLATIDETGQSDGATVTVYCHDLEVTKNADTTFTRTWDWTIDKSADQTELTLSPGQQFLVNYDVDVDASSVDSSSMVQGDIWVENPAFITANITSVSDLVSPDIAATVTCNGNGGGLSPTSTLYSIAAGGTLHCTYTADLPDSASRTNTATATLQNYSYSPLGIATPTGTTDFTGTFPVNFGAPDEEIDECVDVSDTNVGFLGTVCANAAPAMFNYAVYIGPFSDPADCGEQLVDNTASFLTNDTGTTDEDTWTVTVDVICDVGCTLTPGYWKTHSEYGPAPYDDTWALLFDGADTVFFESGQTYYEVLWTPPKGGNAYYILAHAYIAAELNGLNGASAPLEVMNAFDEATDLLENYTPDEIGALKGNKKTRQDFLEKGALLDMYNNGLIGPGHCSEDETSPRR